QAQVFEFQRIAGPIVNFEMKRQHREPYFKFVEFINGKLTAKPAGPYLGEKRRSDLSDTIYSSFSSLTIANYHQDRLCKIESELIRAF
ncbi:hypothetical protein, partial [Salmonella enterica]|uniref:hypothetical protein n=2 Tax=Pseudomonadota TaxID=1224 RepID=UPI003296CD3B